MHRPITGIVNVPSLNQIEISTAVILISWKISKLPCYLTSSERTTTRLPEFRTCKAPRTCSWSKRNTISGGRPGQRWRWRGPGLGRLRHRRDGACYVAAWDRWRRGNAIATMTGSRCASGLGDRWSVHMGPTLCRAKDHRQVWTAVKIR